MEFEIFVEIRENKFLCMPLRKTFAFSSDYNKEKIAELISGKFNELEGDLNDSQ